MLQDSGTPSLSSPLAFVCFSRAAACLSVEEQSHWVLEKRALDPPTLGGRAGGVRQGERGWECGWVSKSPARYLKIPLCRIMQRKGRSSFVNR